MEERGKQIERIMYKLGRLWIHYKQERFFQLLFNYTQLGTRTEPLGTVKDPFHYSDEDLEKYLDHELKAIEDENKNKKDM